MKKMKLISWFVFALIFAFTGLALGGGGGPEDPVCPAGTIDDPLPEPNAGKFLRGDFTVSRVMGMCGDSYYCVHIFLKKGTDRHLFSFQSALGTGDLCSLTALDLMDTFKRLPCTLGVGTAFGLDGVPVTTNLEILISDSCGTSCEMIKGEVVIRVVPFE